jgi:hypothetical protein
MKTAISVPNAVFEAAELLARRLGMSRSELYTTALARFMADYDDRAVTEALDTLYSELDSTLDPVLAAMQRRALAGESW